MTRPTIKRSDFVRHLVQDSGLTYIQAEQAYSSLMRLLENAIATKAEVHLGKIGVLAPIELESRRVTMGFKRSGGRNGGKMWKCRQEFFIGARTRFVFRLYRSFGRNHDVVP